MDSFLFTSCWDFSNHYVYSGQSRVSLSSWHHCLAITSFWSRNCRMTWLHLWKMISVYLKGLWPGKESLECFMRNVPLFSSWLVSPEANFQPRLLWEGSMDTWVSLLHVTHLYVVLYVFLQWDPLCCESLVVVLWNQFSDLVSHETVWLRAVSVTCAWKVAFA